MTSQAKPPQYKRNRKSPSQIRILFLGDHFYREFEIAKRTIAALDADLRSRCETYIMPLDVFSTVREMSFIEIARMRPDIIVAPTVNRAQAWLLPLARWLGSKIIIQHSEQFLINAARGYKIESISLLRLKNIAHLSWTEAHKSDFVASGVPHDEIHVSGSPKLAPLKKLAGEKEASTGKTIGFVSNFALADMEPERLERLKGKFALKSNYQVNQRLKTLRSRFIRMIVSAVRAFPERKFIVRAHPGESLSDYQAMLHSFSNVSLSRDEPFPVFLDGIDAAVMHDSTSIFEIAHRKIPVISIDLGPVDRDWIQQPSELFKANRPRDVLQFVMNPEAFVLQTNQSGLLKEILMQLEAYDERISGIYQKVLNDDRYKLKWRQIVPLGYYSFGRNLLIQFVDHISEKLGIDIISTARRNRVKSDRYGHDLEVVEIER